MSTEFLNSTQQSIAWLKQVHDAGNLEMKPPFQRNPVWTESQKSYLIDTILHGFPIPEIYMQKEVDEHGKEKHIIVDGQQRARSCLEFIEGAFTMNAKDSPEWGDLAFEDLTADDKKRIYGYTFIVRNLPVVGDEILRGIFRRLNRNVVALNAQELRHATYWGPFIKMMEEIADFEIWEGIGVFTANDVRRMIDIEFISEITMAFLHGPQNKKVNLEKTYQIYEKEFDDATKVRSMFMQVLGGLTQILPELRTTRWKKKSDFYTLILTCASHLNQLPLSKDKRTKAHGLLLRFGEEIDLAVTTNPAEKKRIKGVVKKYADAVERSASDLGNRKARAEALEEVLKPVFS
jgi:hypothetical protein